MFAREISASGDFTVSTAPTVTAALDILDARDPVDCIVSDYTVPAVDGLALLRSVRAQYPDIPFVLFTSEGNERVASEAVSARVTEYLIKDRFQDQWDELATLINDSIAYQQKQRSLTDSASRIKILLEASPDSIAIVQDAAFSYVNQCALDLFEVTSLGAIADNSVTAYIAAADRATVARSLNAIRTGDARVDRFDVTATGHKGTRTPVEITAISIEWDGSDAILLIFRNISEKEDMQLELRRFRRVAEAAGHAIYLTDADGRIEYVNPAFESITGFSSSDAIGRNPRIMNSGEMSEDYYESLWGTIRSGDIWEEELVNQRKDGKLYHAYQTIAPITDANGQARGFVAIQRDISDRIQQERNLQAQKERYESLFDSIRDAILVANTDRQIVDCNPAFTELFGYEPDDIKGKHTRCVYESAEEYEAMGEAIDGHFGDPQFTTIVRYEKQSGKMFPGETNVYYLRDHEGQVTGFIGLIRDVSDKQERVTQLQILDRVLRHNFHNALTVILGNSEFIQNETSGSVADSAKRIFRTGENLLDAVDKERQVTNLLADPPAPEAIDLALLLETLVSAIADSHSAADVRLHAPESCEVSVPPEIEQAIRELIENAIEHSDRVQPSVEVTLERSADETSVIITDDGPGIPEMEQEVLTGEKRIEPLYHGSGLDLWFVNLVVRRADGVLEFDENEPRGSVVRIVFSTD
ncbi:PAS domain S-box protein [Halorhabdus tiamatea]|uniref:PAS domain S-box protein n=1 Tax=Halorhabdus tiamatea TaxID=430914 RepID=UPI00130EFAB7|nr:PAS domain S-box protein [Halorhabdus tiamatea]